MPLCYCQWANCSGKTVSKRVSDEHRRQDKRVQVSAALKAADRVIEEQDSSIATYIATLTLSDETTGSSTRPGGRLWARDTDSSSGNTSPSSSHNYLAVTEALRIISDVNNQLQRLAAAIEEPLRRIGKPTTAVDIFPLKSHLREACLLENRLSSVTISRPSVLEAKRPVADGVVKLLAQLKVAESTWGRASKIFSQAQERVHSFDTSHHFDPILPGVDPIIQTSIFTMVALQVIMHASRRGCHFLLAMLKYIVQLALMRRNHTLIPSDAKLLSDFPSHPDSVVQGLHLNGNETILAVCPNSKCHKTYRPTFKGKSPIPVYPPYCTHKQFASGSECGTRLTCPRALGDTEIQFPIKRFVSFSFKDFVANLTSRPGFEDIMDACSIGQDGIMRDLHDGQFLRKEFKGPDGAPFYSTPQDARYVFSLCIDFFNPFTNKQSGKKASVGIISVVCLSLPPSQRYRSENMFLAGIIPGPNEPPLTTINHYLTPVIDDTSVYPFRPLVRSVN